MAGDLRPGEGHTRCRRESPSGRLETGKEVRRVSQTGARLEAWAWMPDGRLIAVLESRGKKHALFDFSAAQGSWPSAAGAGRWGRQPVCGFSVGKTARRES